MNDTPYWQKVAFKIIGEVKENDKESSKNKPQAKDPMAWVPSPHGKIDRKNGNSNGLWLNAADSYGRRVAHGREKLDDPRCHGKKRECLCWQKGYRSSCRFSVDVWMCELRP